MNQNHTALAQNSAAMAAAAVGFLAPFLVSYRRGRKVARSAPLRRTDSTTDVMVPSGSGGAYTSLRRGGLAALRDNINRAQHQAAQAQLQAVLAAHLSALANANATANTLAAATANAAASTTAVATTDAAATTTAAASTTAAATTPAAATTTAAATTSATANANATDDDEDDDALAAPAHHPATATSASASEGSSSLTIASPQRTPTSFSGVSKRKRESQDDEGSTEKRRRVGTEEKLVSRVEGEVRADAAASISATHDTPMTSAPRAIAGSQRFAQSPLASSSTSSIQSNPTTATAAHALVAVDNMQAASTSSAAHAIPMDVDAMCDAPVALTSNDAGSSSSARGPVRFTVKEKGKAKQT